MRKESKQKPGPLHVGLEIEQLLALDDGGRREYLSALLLEDFSPEWLAFVEHYRESLQRLEVTVSQKVIAIPVAALLAGVDRTLLDKVEKWVKMALGLESGAASLTIAPTGKPHPRQFATWEG